MSLPTPIKNQELDWSAEQLKLITDTVARGATPDELKLFLYRCKNMGLDPLKPGQIHFVKYGTSPGTIVVGIDGFRSRAASTGQMSGVSRGVVKDAKGILLSAWCEIRRKGWDAPVREEVPLAEYNTGKGPWAKMPETMLKKVAEACALRMAFPDELGGLYTNEEMDQAEKNSHRVAPQAPEAGDGVQENGVPIPYGPLAKQYVHEADPAKLRDYILSEEAKWAKRGLKEPPLWARAMVAAAEPIIADFENQPA